MALETARPAPMSARGSRLKEPTPGPSLPHALPPVRGGPRSQHFAVRVLCVALRKNAVPGPEPKGLLPPLADAFAWTLPVRATPVAEAEAVPPPNVLGAAKGRRRHMDGPTARRLAGRDRGGHPAHAPGELNATATRRPRRHWQLRLLVTAPAPASAALSWSQKVAAPPSRPQHRGETKI